MAKFNFKKVAVIGMAAIMAVSAVSICAFAAENNTAHDNKLIDVIRAYDRISVYIVDSEHYNRNEESYEKVIFNEECRPFIDGNGRTQIPLRNIAETLNFEVNWIENERKITISKGQDNIILYADNADININGTTVRMDTAPQIIDGYTYIPLRYIGEALGYEVNYSEAEDPGSYVTGVEDMWNRDAVN